MTKSSGSSVRAAILATALASITSVSGCAAGSAESPDILSPTDSTQVVGLDFQQPVCSDCIHMRRLVALGDTVGEGFVVPTQHAVRDSMGRYWLNQRKQIKVFDGSGVYVGEVGRPGKGPMEFSLPLPVFTDEHGDVHVIDPVNARETTINSEFGRVADTRLPARGRVNDAEPMPGGRYLFNMWSVAADGTGIPLHVFSGDSILYSFGADSSHPGSQDLYKLLRMIATDHEGRAFSAQRSDYDIGVWTGTGRPIVRLSGPKLNEHEVLSTPANLTDNPLPNQIQDIRVDDANHLWVLSWQTRPDWRRHYEAREFPGGLAWMQFRKGSTMDSVYTSRIDVIDLHQGRLVAQLNRDGLLTGFVGDGLILQNAELPDGTPQIEIWEVSAELPEE